MKEESRLYGSNRMGKKFPAQANRFVAASTSEMSRFESDTLSADGDLKNRFLSVRF